MKKSLYVSDDYYRPEALMQEMLERLTGIGAAFTNKAEAKKYRMDDSKLRKYCITVIMKRLPLGKPKSRRPA